MRICLKNNFLSLILFSLSLMFSQQALALGKVGHQVICQLAFDHLSVSTQNKVTELLTTLPKRHKKLINEYNHKNVNTKVTFADSCTWADAIKKDKNFDKFKKWHYLNVSRDNTEVTSNNCDKNCITQAIKIHTKLLSKNNKPSKTSSWEQLQALMFLGHWIGDIHQPMHINFKSDLGGNKTKVIMYYSNLGHLKKAKCNNMHWLWDECLLYPSAKTRNRDLIKQLQKTLTQRWDSSPISSWQNSSVYQWATESLIIARTPSVLYCKMNNAIDEKKYCIPREEKIIKLPLNYQKQHKNILEKRLLQAAARLTSTLESSL